MKYDTFFTHTIHSKEYSKMDAQKKDYQLINDITLIQESFWENAQHGTKLQACWDDWNNREFNQMTDEQVVTIIHAAIEFGVRRYHNLLAEDTNTALTHEPTYSTENGGIVSELDSSFDDCDNCQNTTVEELLDDILTNNEGVNIYQKEDGFWACEFGSLNSSEQHELMRQMTIFDAIGYAFHEVYRSYYYEVIYPKRQVKK